MPVAGSNRISVIVSFDITTQKLVHKGRIEITPPSTIYEPQEAASKLLAGDLVRVGGLRSQQEAVEQACVAALSSFGTNVPEPPTGG